MHPFLDEGRHGRTLPTEAHPRRHRHGRRSTHVNASRLALVDGNFAVVRVIGVLTPTESRRGHHSKLDWWFPPSGARTTSSGELVDASLRAGPEHDPADDQVAEDVAGLGDLASQHGLPGRETMPDLQLQNGGSPCGRFEGHVPLEQEPLVPCRRAHRWSSSRGRQRGTSASRKLRPGPRFSSRAVSVDFSS
jgi:hypothetical protein